MNKTVREIETLRRIGPCTTAELADAAGTTPGEISHNMRKHIAMNKYGVYIAGTATRRNGGASVNLWAVDEAKYAEYLLRKGKGGRQNQNAPLKPKSPKLPKPVITRLRTLPAVVGKFQTQWQPSSPYYQGNRK